MVDNTVDFTPHIHEDFQLNKNQLNESGLIQLSTYYIQEGEPHEQEIGNFFLEWLDDMFYKACNLLLILKNKLQHLEIS